MPKALAYLRTSSATNVDGDSSVRQRAAIASYAAAHGIEIVAEFYDAAVSGADPIAERPGFGAMLARIAGNGVRMIVVENADRFARDLMVQEQGILALRALGVALVTAQGIDMTAQSADPTMKFHRQMTGGMAEYVKALTVQRLKDARDRKSAALGRECSGRKGMATERPEVVDAIRAIRADDPRATLQTIADRLAEQGFMTTGSKTRDGDPAPKPFQVAQIHRICKANGIGKGAA